VIICEASATKVRSRTIAVATAVQAMLGIVMTVAIPYMINPDEANIRGKLGFFFGKKLTLNLLRNGPALTLHLGGLSAFCFVWAWFRIPETMGRTYEELDLMFERNLKTREFKHYKVV
jgi:MFS transporter, SP family, general alpha glucoside:H+ symporter